MSAFSRALTTPEPNLNHSCLDGRQEGEGDIASLPPLSFDQGRDTGWESVPNMQMKGGKSLSRVGGRKAGGRMERYLGKGSPGSVPFLSEGMLREREEWMSGWWCCH